MGTISIIDRHLEKSQEMKAKLEFKLQDLWIGAFWKRDHTNSIQHLWICLVPCLPLHIQWKCDREASR